MGNFTAFETKMTAAGMGDAAIRAFRRNYEALLRNETGMIPEETISPAVGLPSFESIASAGSADPALLSQAVVIKLNGGLGTSMGLQGPKSLLSVRDGVNFLDLMVRQILDLRKSSGANVRLLLMNSFSTSRDTLTHLEKYRAEGLADAAEVELMQNQIPKIDAATLEPVAWPADPDLEWCPPGHGDLYPALVGSGWLDRLLAEGVKYAFVSNSDNLGAMLDPAILRLFRQVRRAVSDGGHAADGGGPQGRAPRSDESPTAACCCVRWRKVRMRTREAFQDIDRHPYFNTNSLWLRLDLLKEQLAADAGVLPLPMIRNNKTVDPRDKKSTPVVQLEIAMGAAIECFEGAAAIDVPRSRFAPVKTTGDLLALRSDAYEVLENGQVRLAASRNGVPPVISLSDEYKLVDQIEALGVPSLIDCNSLRVSGPLKFAPGVIVRGDVSFENSSGGTTSVDAGIYADQSVKC